MRFITPVVSPSSFNFAMRMSIWPLPSVTSLSNAILVPAGFHAGRSSRTLLALVPSRSWGLPSFRLPMKIFSLLAPFQRA